MPEQKSGDKLSIADCFILGAIATITLIVIWLPCLR